MHRLQRLVRELHQLFGMRAGLLESWGLLQHAQADGQRGERLAGLVVQLAGDALALILLCREHLPRERL
jgi:hypothetical protein